MSRITQSVPRRLRGYIVVPGNRTISHLAIMLNAVAEGSATLTNVPAGPGCLSTMVCMQALGASIQRHNDVLHIGGIGLAGLPEPAGLLECGSSGLTMQLLAALLAGLPISAVLSADAALRPCIQQQVIPPLRMLGASLDYQEDGDQLHLLMQGTSLHGGSYDLYGTDEYLAACLLLAALNGDAPCTFTGFNRSCDHVGRLFASMGIEMQQTRSSLTLYPPPRHANGLPVLQAQSLRIPGDPSAAVYWWVAAAIHADAELTTPAVCLNPTQSEALKVLQAMDARITIAAEHQVAGEPVGDVTVCSSLLRGVTIAADQTLRLADVLPVLTVAAACASGATLIQGIRQLPPRDLNRMLLVVHGLQSLGVHAEVDDDTMHILGSAGDPLRGAVLHSHGDYVLAMTWAIAAFAAHTETTIAEATTVQARYPGFWERLALLEDNQ